MRPHQNHMTMFKINTEKPEIVATLGPSTEHEDVLKKILDKGMSVARFNFSHGDHDTQKKRLTGLRSLVNQEQKDVIVFADLSGPKVRVGKIEGGSCELITDTLFILTTDAVLGGKERVSVTYQRFTEGIQQGISILLDDGRLELLVEKIDGSNVHTKVVRGGTLLEEKGVNVPDATWSMSSLTEKDANDLHFVMDASYDAVALSFVRTKENIEEVRTLMQSTYGKTLPIITKIETRQSLHNLDSIIQSSDCIMVARGDLGVEIGIEHVPLQQKRICELAQKYQKPVIVATQLLESMVESPTPTRAEVSDVVNAILDGASYVMLSDETTIGKHPVECIEILETIITGYKTQV